MENQTFNFKSFKKALYEKDSHPTEYHNLSDYAGMLKGEERLEAIELVIKNLSVKNSRDKRIIKTIEALDSKELNAVYQKHIKSSRPQKTNPTTEKAYYAGLLEQIEGKSAAQTVEILHLLLKSLKRYDGKENMIRKSIFKLLKKLPKLKGVDLNYQYILKWPKSKKMLNQEEVLNLLKMKIVDSKVANYSDDALLLRFVNKKLDKVYKMNKCYYQGPNGYRGIQLSEEEKDFNYQDYKENGLYNIKFTKKGKNIVGGSSPEQFKIPGRIGNVPFDYLAFLSKEDKAFNWLPFDLHIACPILLDNFNIVYLDYSNPLAPKLLNRPELEKCSFQEKIPDGFQRTFQAKPFNLSKTFITLSDRDKRASGVPVWIQYPDVIKCPKSGKAMKFLFQLFTNNRQKTVIKSGIPHCDTLNFWLDGCFYVFFEPESKVAAMFIQNT